MNKKELVTIAAVIAGLLVLGIILSLTSVPPRTPYQPLPIPALESCLKLKPPPPDPFRREWSDQTRLMPLQGDFWLPGEYERMLRQKQLERSREIERN